MYVCRDKMEDQVPMVTMEQREIVETEEALALLDLLEMMAFP